ncbi:MAG TPA: hypothetical protein VKY92_02720 [Verrucomicrobiae bacterium]|nr:hypothetical protein [Verrucomicrobiae bacterium]
MAKGRIAGVAFLLLVAVCVLVAAGRAKREPVLTARVVKVERQGSGLTVGVQINNQADCIYFLLDAKVESWGGTGWGPGLGVTAGFSDEENFNWNLAYLHSTVLRICAIKPVKHGTRLRGSCEGSDTATTWTIHFFG